jgi:GNAT superfamily N-acetyltransferase
VDADALILSALAAKAKADWGYSLDVLRRWRSELTVTPRHIRTKRVYVAARGTKIAGFCLASPSRTSWELEHLWVAPAHMRRGVGSALLAHALSTAHRSGVREVTVDADPNAEQFYLQHGAVRRGSVSAPIPRHPQRIRPQLAFNAARKIAAPKRAWGLSGIKGTP